MLFLPFFPNKNSPQDSTLHPNPQPDALSTILSKLIEAGGASNVGGFWVVPNSRSNPQMKLVEMEKHTHK